MKVEIESVDNGYVVRHADGTNVFEHKEDSECFALRDALYAVCEGLAYFGSKHSEYRLHIDVKDQDGNEVFYSHKISK